MSKTLCVAGCAVLFLSVMAIEGGALGLAAGSVLGIAGAMLFLATYRQTGWFYET